MFFDDPISIPDVAKNTGFSIFVVPTEIVDVLSNFPTTTFYLTPDEKNSIRVDKIRDLEAEMLNKETSDRFFVIRHAETMNESAENAALKLLEEPKENCHLIFLTTGLTTFLPTILSRANIYILKTTTPLDTSPSVDKDILNEAKLLLSSSSTKTFAIIKRWTDKSGKKSRPEILQILNTTVELSYKSYFKTGKTVFLKKIPALIAAYDNIRANGHIKLQLTAHLC